MERTEIVFQSGVTAYAVMRNNETREMKEVFPHLFDEADMSYDSSTDEDGDRGQLCRQPVNRNVYESDETKNRGLKAKGKHYYELDEANEYRRQEMPDFDIEQWPKSPPCQYEQLEIISV